VEGGLGESLLKISQAALFPAAGCMLVKSVSGKLKAR
jgi:hypothetical protein